MSEQEWEVLDEFESIEACMLINIYCDDCPTCKHYKECDEIARGIAESFLHA